MQNVSISDRFSSLTLAFSFATPKKRGLLPLAREKGRRRVFALPSSLSRFISIFLRAFCVQFHLASLPCRVLFLFPRLSLCHSRSRRACSSCFSPLTYQSPLTSPFSFLSLSFSPFLCPSHPFHDCRSVSLHSSPSFFLSLGRFIASSSTLRSPPPTPVPPRLFLSLFCRVRWFHLLDPSSPRPSKTLFSRGPFASMVIRHPSSLSLSPSPSSSFFFSHPNGREKQPPLSLVLPHIAVHGIHPSLFLRGFFSLPLSIHLSFFLFLSLPYLLTSASPPLLSLLSPCCAGSFSAERLLRFSSVIDVASSPLPGLFPFAATILETTANQLFLRENASGNDRRRSPLLPPLPHPRTIHAFPGWKDWNLPGEFPPFSSFAVPTLVPAICLSLPWLLS